MNTDGWRTRPCLVSALLLLSLWVCTSAFAQQPTEPPKQPSPHRALDRACDVLRRSAVKGPYGWGWPASFDANTAGTGASAGSKKSASAGDRESPPADIDLRVTAATGLLLQIASKDLNSEPDALAAL